MIECGCCFGEAVFEQMIQCIEVCLLKSAPFISHHCHLSPISSIMLSYKQRLHAPSRVFLHLAKSFPVIPYFPASLCVSHVFPCFFEGQTESDAANSPICRCKFSMFFIEVFFYKFCQKIPHYYLLPFQSLPIILFFFISTRVTCSAENVCKVTPVKRFSELAKCNCFV